MNVRERLIAVARRLGELNSSVVYVGGSAVHFLIQETMVASLRHTEDVDVVVSANLYYEIQEFSQRLREAGFVENREDGVICRWSVDGMVVDVMPSGEKAFGFSNQWYDQVLRDTQEIEVAPGLHCRFPNLGTFLATKFDAFGDRGGGDYWGDADFEDIAMVLAYSDDVVEAIAQAPRGKPKEVVLVGTLGEAGFDESGRLGAKVPGDAFDQILFASRKLVELFEDRAGGDSLRGGLFFSSPTTCPYVGFARLTRRPAWPAP